MSSEPTPAGLAALDPEYWILGEIGRGGTAIVYLARERATGAEVAIKLIRPKYLEDEEAVARFAREARYVAQLAHPNVVGVQRVLDLGAGGIALVMTHINGRTLKQVIHDERPLPQEFVTRVVRDVAAALSAAHAMGIIHRDVKPENVFITEDGRALLADFGVARSMSGETQLTMHGVAIGTPSYMAPEQIEGEQLDGRADIYSLGLVAWEMFTGHRPWEGDSLYAVLYHQRHHELPDVRDMRPDVSDDVADVIAGAIEKDPSARWQSMDELIAALDGAAPDRRAKAHVPVSTETVRFARPNTPAAGEPALPAPPNEPPLPMVAPNTALSPFESGFVGAYFTADELEEVKPARRGIVTRRRVLAGAGVAGVVALALLAKSVDGRVGARPRPPVAATSRASSGEVGAGQAGHPLADSASVIATVLARRDSVRRADSLAQASSAEALAAAADSADSVAATAPDTPEGVELDASPAPEPRRPAPERAEERRPAPVPVVAAPAAPEAPTRTRFGIFTGGLHTCLVSGDGRAYCWGGNDEGQLGTGGSEGSRSSRPSAVGGDLRFVDMAPGLAHSCALARGGAAWCWGENSHGQLGDRSETAREAPVRSATGHTFRSIAAGAAHTCGVDLDGVAWCWGSDAHGQLGDGGVLDRPYPVPVAGGQRFVRLDVGWNFTCGLTESGRAMCWGDNSAGQLGDGTTTDRRRPVPVQGNIEFAAITAGSAHTCGVTRDGAAYCWGRNASGELGDGSTSPRSTPVRVLGGERFVSIAAGAVHTCAVTSGGDAWCWGRNTYGQLGNGDTSDSGEPVRVAGGHAFAGIRAFGSHTCATTPSGEAFCWGYNSDGQLGDGTRTHRTRPVYVERPGG
jgi:alpha-tubulin suppressor-like RCC1 family protein/tRNA A-37 threonylcarbamoyl transferase component Bud32